MMSKHRYSSSKQKYDLFKSWDILLKIRLYDATAQLNVFHSTLNRILKNHLKIKRTTLETESSNQKRKSCKQSR